ncbi:ATP-grasp domain-containing protein [Streptomyces celluloflavus]|uniref:ATP-grasp domain-containing protein n=1 Tax=Streptomyces celluloflavus TaxID=58344 RepID=UPI00369B6E72
MPARGTVALVDAYSSAHRLAPLFRERGYRCVHVRSTPVIPAVYAGSFVAGDFAAEVVHDGALDDTVRQLRAQRPVALLAGIESGVELADELSEALGLRTNGTALSAARRDKFRMAEAVRAAGLRAARQLLTADEDELRAWYEEMAREQGSAGRVVVKPVKSAGNDGVFFCDSPEEAGAAFRAIVGTRSALSLENDAVLAQEYLWGGEFYVNTVSLDGVHHVCDVWKTSHLHANGVRDLLDGAWLLERHGPVQDRLVRYACGVLDALGIRNGPSHTELKLTPDGPCLIETGARVCGGDLPNLVRRAVGESQLEWTADAYTDPERFRSRAQTPYTVREFVSSQAVVAPRPGTLLGYPRLDEVKALESFHEVKMAVAPGERVHRTVNDFTIPLLINLAHPVQDVVLRDFGTVRYLDGEGFYDLA